ncbi:GNAT family N-acetyltransferase [Aeromicrobium sp.]|uniref:GNAT family N-acetyltransferase n=1 Tax=Aeromicrobium sp. TaxID=1871063 RepID=UPI0028AEF1A6|nr:GNAT family N-acetyltransferase [Aeromicrobium sp.]
MTTETVQQAQDPDRFEITVDGKVAGFTQFVDADGRRIFFHTKIDEEFGGQGLAGTVVGEALDRTRGDGLRVVAVCPYVAKYLEKHPGYEDVTDPVTPDAIALAKRAAA